MAHQNVPDSLPPEPPFSGVLADMIGSRSLWSELYVPGLAAIVVVSLVAVLVPTGASGPAGDPDALAFDPWEDVMTDSRSFENRSPDLSLPTALTALLAVETNASGASVWVDGARLGTAPIRDLTVRAGLRYVRVMRGETLLLDTLVVMRDGGELVLNVRPRATDIARAQRFNDPVRSAPVRALNVRQPAGPSVDRVGWGTGEQRPDAATSGDTSRPVEPRQPVERQPGRVGW
jgi:hypothetical protein